MPTRTRRSTPRSTRARSTARRPRRRTLTVTVPPDTATGTYDVTVTATERRSHAPGHGHRPGRLGRAVARQSRRSRRSADRRSRRRRSRRAVAGRPPPTRPRASRGTRPAGASTAAAGRRTSLDDAIRHPAIGPSRPATRTRSASGRATRPATGRGWKTLDGLRFAVAAGHEHDARARRARGARRRSRSWSRGSALYSRSTGATRQQDRSPAAASRGSPAFGPSRGTARVYVDGVLADTIDLYRSSTSYRRIMFSKALGDERRAHDPRRGRRDVRPSARRPGRVRRHPLDRSQASRASPAGSESLRQGGRVTLPIDRAAPGAVRAVGHARTAGKPVARSMWKGAIQFGLVTIPVKLYTRDRVRLRDPLQHAPRDGPVADPDEDLVPGRRRRSSRARDTVKGYEYAPDQYVVITDEDLEKVPLKTVRSIEIEQFTTARARRPASTRSS